MTDVAAKQDFPRSSDFLVMEQYIPFEPDRLTLSDLNIPDFCEDEDGGRYWD